MLSAAPYPIGLRPGIVRQPDQGPLYPQGDCLGADRAGAVMAEQKVAGSQSAGSRRASRRRS